MTWEEIIKIKSGSDYPRDIELPESFYEEKTKKMIRNIIYRIGDEPSFNYTGEGNPKWGQNAGHRVLEDERVVKLMNELHPLFKNLIKTAIEVKHEGSPKLQGEEL
jgi:hypothetical protein